MAKHATSSKHETETKPWIGVVFTLAGGFVWASWPGTEASVNLGKHDVVSAMMQDFLAQNALGERLAKTSENSGAPSGA